MDLRWTSKGLSGLTWLHEFLAPANRPAAARVVRSLTAAATKLAANPRIGGKLDEFGPREVRRLPVGHYEMRYDVQADTIYVLRLWHTREDR